MASSATTLVLCLVAMLIALQVVAKEETEPEKSKKTYTDYSVFRLIPETQEQVEALLRLEETLKLDMWTPPRVGDPADIMVAPDSKQRLMDAIVSLGITIDILHDDVEAYNNAVDRQQTAQQLVPRLGESGDTIDNSRYLRFDEINKYITKLLIEHPNTVRAHDIGATFEGRRMRVVQLSRCFTCNYGAIWVDAGIHAREWIAPATALYAMSQLAENATANHQMLDNLDWYILPSANPDGYEYTFTTDRLWRKTRSTTSRPTCRGADPNRNFDYKWNMVGASNNSCSQIYAGSSAFSEIETRNIRNFLWQRRTTLKMYISYHSYGNFLLYPWGFTKQLPPDWKDLDNVAKHANAAMVKAGSRPYTVGSSTNTLYAAAGGSDDWSKGILGVKYAFTIELPGYNYGFQLPPKYIDAIAKQSFEGLRVFAQAAKGHRAERAANRHKRRASRNRKFNN